MNYSIYFTTFFSWHAFCPTFGINWTTRIYSLTNCLLWWFIYIRFIFCQKKHYSITLSKYSIKSPARATVSEYTELTKPCLNRKITGRLGHPWFSPTPTGVDEGREGREGSTQNEDWDWEWDVTETWNLVFALARVPKVQVTLWSWPCPWGPGDSLIRIDGTFQTVTVKNLDVNFLFSPKL